LREKEANAGVPNINSKKEVQLTQVLEFKLKIKTSDDTLKEHSRGTRQDNVVDIHEKISHFCARAHHKQGGVRASRGETNVAKKPSNASVPSPGSVASQKETWRVDRRDLVNRD
jgi:hypothetical protein